MVALFAGHGPDAWRITAQIVATLAAVGLLFPIYAVTRLLFDHRIACLAAALAVVLPRAAELGHDTLSDSLGLLATFLALWLGAVSLRTRDWRAGIGLGPRRGSGISGAARGNPRARRDRTGLDGRASSRSFDYAPSPRARLVAAVFLASLVVVGSYRLVKGEVSEKLAVRVVVPLWPKPMRVRRFPRRCRAGSTTRVWISRPKKKQTGSRSETGEHAVVRIVEQVVGATVLVLRGHDHLGPGAPAIHPRAVPGARPE